MANWADAGKNPIRDSMGAEAYNRMVAKLSAITTYRELDLFRYRADLAERRVARGCRRAALRRASSPRAKARLKGGLAFPEADVGDPDSGPTHNQSLLQHKVGCRPRFSPLRMMYVSGKLSGNRGPLTFGNLDIESRRPPPSGPMSR